jgi:hypothetical protein
MEKKTRVKLMYSIAAVFLALGLLLNYLNVGSPDFQIFGGVGNWLIYTGFISLMIATVRMLTTPMKQRVVDERMEFVAAKANRITFLALIV